MKILVVGAAGYVASIVVPSLEAAHACRLLDRKPVPGREGVTILADVTDEVAIAKAVEGVDAVIYLAMGVANPNASSIAGHRVDIMAIGPAFAVNVAGWFNCLQYGLRAGVRKFIYASTISVWTPEHQAVAYDESLPANAFHTYGISKQAAEFIAQRAAQEYRDGTFIALRLYAPRTDADYATFLANRDDTPYLGPKDTRALIDACLACTHPGFHCIMASGDREERLYIHRRARDILGWAPRGE